MTDNERRWPNTTETARMTAAEFQAVLKAVGFDTRIDAALAEARTRGLLPSDDTVTIDKYELERLRAIERTVKLPTADDVLGILADPSDDTEGLRDRIIAAAKRVDASWNSGDKPNANGEMGWSAEFEFREAIAELRAALAEDEQAGHETATPPAEGLDENPCCYSLHEFEQVCPRTGTRFTP